MQLRQRQLLHWRHQQSKYLLNKGLVGRDVFVSIANLARPLLLLHTDSSKKIHVRRDVFVNIA